jgi:probable phosphoglycerate mutase
MNPESPKTIFLIRHGQSTGNGKGCMIGWTDHPLTDVGRAQAAAVGARLAVHGPMPVHCSDLSRACATAQLVAAVGGGPVLPDARWREVHCGAYEDAPWSAFSGDTTLQSLFDDDPLGTCMPGGESVAQMRARVEEAFAALLADPAPRLAVVAHDGPIRAILAHCLQIPASRYWALTTHHGGVTTLTVIDGWINVLCVNDTSHLAGIAGELTTT